MTSPIYIGADNAVLFDELKDSSTDEFINSGATLTFTLYGLLTVDGGMTAGSAVLTSAAGLFVAGDVGRSVVVRCAGPNGSDLRTTITGVTSGTSVTLATAASQTVANAQIRLSPAGAQNVAVSYVAGSDGSYRGTLNDTVPLVDRGRYWLELTIDGGDGRKDFRVIEVIAKYRT